MDTKEPWLFNAKTVLTTSPRREIWKVMIWVCPLCIARRVLAECQSRCVFHSKTARTVDQRDAPQDFAKAGASTLLMPLWSEDELNAAGQSLYSLTEQEVQDLFAKWGGSARYVLQHAKNPSRQKDLDEAITDANIDKIYQAVGAPASAQDVSGSLPCRRTTCAPSANRERCL